MRTVLRGARAAQLLAVITLTSPVAIAAPIPDASYALTYINGSGFPTPIPLNDLDRSTQSGSYRVSIPTICPGCNEGGVAFASASLSGGYLKASVQALPATGLPGRAGSANAVAEIGARIYLSGPAGVSGDVAVNMHVSGSFSTMPSPLPGDATNVYTDGEQIYYQSGSWFGYPSPGLAVVDALAAYNATQNIGGPNLYELQCENCTATTSNPIPGEITSLLHFDAGQDYVDYWAQLLLTAAGDSTIDISHTATFSIGLPEGFSETSALSFATAGSIPEPASLILLGSALAGLALVHRPHRNSWLEDPC